MATVLTAEQAIIDHFRSGFVPRDQWRIGMEVEHVCLRSGWQRIRYEGGRGSVGAVLDDLLEPLGGTPDFEDGHLIGLHSPHGKVTLEPGGQIEWSSPPCSSLHELTQRLDYWLSEFRIVLNRHDVVTLDRGFDAITPLRAVPWVPKSRYRAMRERYSGGPSTAYRAMTNTAGVHVSVDYADREDWRRKYRAMLLATPIVAAVFGNSPVRITRRPYRAIRPLLWLGMDPARCDPPPAAFRDDFQLEDWARWVCQVPRLFEPTGPGGVEDWMLHLSSVFTPVRCSRHLEVRTIDMQSDDRLPAAPAFWYGLLYSDRALSGLLETLAPYGDPRRWRRDLERACRHGRSASPEIAERTEQVLALARGGLRELAEASADDPWPALTALDRVAA